MLIFLFPPPLLEVLTQYFPALSCILWLTCQSHYQSAILCGGGVVETALDWEALLEDIALLSPVNLYSSSSSSPKEKNICDFFNLDLMLQSTYVYTVCYYIMYPYSKITLCRCLLQHLWILGSPVSQLSCQARGSFTQETSWSDK